MMNTKTRDEARVVSLIQDQPICLTTDRDGTDLIGSDKDGVWVGTDCAPLVLGNPGPIDCPILLVVNGFLGSEMFVAYLAVSDAERALQFVRGLGVREVTLDEGGCLLGRIGCEPHTWLDLSDEELDVAPW